MKRIAGMMFLIGCLSFFLAGPIQEGSAMTVTYTTKQGQNRAVLHKPQGPGPFPVIIYNHGAVVEFDGYEGARERGYDLDGMAESLAAEGFIVFAPLRETGVDQDSEHVALINDAVDYAKTLPQADPSHVAMVGFSRGASLSYLAARGRNDLRALVLLALAGGEGFLNDRPDQRRFKVPVLLLIAADDIPERVELMDIAQREISTGGGEVRAIRYPQGGGHELFWKKDYYWQDLRSFLEEKLKFSGRRPLRL